MQMSGLPDEFGRGGVEKMSEVYIRSQNKEKLLMLGSNGILRYYKEIGSNDNHMICFETESEMYDLGKYKQSTVSGDLR